MAQGAACVRAEGGVMGMDQNDNGQVLVRGLMLAVMIAGGAVVWAWMIGGLL